MQNKKKNCKEFSIKDVSVITVITCFVSFFVAFNIKKTNNQIEMDEYSQELLENYNYILHCDCHTDIRNDSCLKIPV